MSMSTILLLTPQGLKCRPQTAELCGSLGVGRTNLGITGVASLQPFAPPEPHALPPPLRRKGKKLDWEGTFAFVSPAANR
jgi:hypothetical protein